MLEDGLFSLLTADSTIHSLIGTRLYPVQGVPDQPMYPYVTYQNVAGGPTEYSFQIAQTKHARIQFDIFGQTFSEGKQVISAISDVLSGFSGVLSDPQTTRIIICEELNTLDNFDVLQRSYRSISEFDFAFS